MKVIGWIRKINNDGSTVDPVEDATVEGEADDYETARDLAAAKLPPEGWKLIGWTVPDHLPG